MVPIDNLMRHQMVVVNRCCMCLRDGELGAFVYSLSGPQGALECGSCFVGHVVGFSFEGGGAYSGMLWG